MRRAQLFRRHSLLTIYLFANGSCNVWRGVFIPYTRSFHESRTLLESSPPTTAKDSVNDSFLPTSSSAHDLPSDRNGSCVFITSSTPKDNSSPSTPSPRFQHKKIRPKRAAHHPSLSSSAPLSSYSTTRSSVASPPVNPRFSSFPGSTVAVPVTTTKEKEHTAEEPLHPLSSSISSSVNRQEKASSAFFGFLTSELPTPPGMTSPFSTKSSILLERESSAILQEDEEKETTGPSSSSQKTRPNALSSDAICSYLSTLQRVYKTSNRHLLTQRVFSEAALHYLQDLLPTQVKWKQPSTEEEKEVVMSHALPSREKMNGVRREEAVEWTSAMAVSVLRTVGVFGFPLATLPIVEEAIQFLLTTGSSPSFVEEEEEATPSAYDVASCDGDEMKKHRDEDDSPWETSAESHRRERRERGQQDGLEWGQLALLVHRLLQKEKRNRVLASEIYLSDMEMEGTSVAPSSSTSFALSSPSPFSVEERTREGCSSSSSGTPHDTSATRSSTMVEGTPPGKGTCAIHPHGSSLHGRSRLCFPSWHASFEEDAAMSKERPLLLFHRPSSPLAGSPRRRGQGPPFLSALHHTTHGAPQYSHGERSMKEESAWSVGETSLLQLYIQVLLPQMMTQLRRLTAPLPPPSTSCGIPSDPHFLDEGKENIHDVEKGPVSPSFPTPLSPFNRVELELWSTTLSVLQKAISLHLVVPVMSAAREEKSDGKGRTGEVRPLVMPHTEAMKEKKEGEQEAHVETKIGKPNRNRTDYIMFRYPSSSSSLLRQGEEVEEVGAQEGEPTKDMAAVTSLPIKKIPLSDFVRGMERCLEAVRVSFSSSLERKGGETSADTSQEGHDLPKRDQQTSAISTLVPATRSPSPGGKASHQSSILHAGDVSGAPAAAAAPFRQRFTSRRKGPGVRHESPQPPSPSLPARAPTLTGTQNINQDIIQPILLFATHSSALDLFFSRKRGTGRRMSSPAMSSSDVASLSSPLPQETEPEPGAAHGTGTEMDDRHGLRQDAPDWCTPLAHCIFTLLRWCMECMPLMRTRHLAALATTCSRILQPAWQRSPSSWSQSSPSPPLSSSFHRSGAPLYTPTWWTQQIACSLLFGHPFPSATGVPHPTTKNDLISMPPSRSSAVSKEKENTWIRHALRHLLVSMCYRALEIQSFFSSSDTAAFLKGLSGVTHSWRLRCDADAGREVGSLPCGECSVFNDTCEVLLHDTIHGVIQHLEWDGFTPIRAVSLILVYDEKMQSFHAISKRIPRYIAKAAGHASSSSQEVLTLNEYCTIQQSLETMTSTLPDTWLQVVGRLFHDIHFRTHHPDIVRYLLRSLFTHPMHGFHFGVTEGTVIAFLKSTVQYMPYFLWYPTPRRWDATLPFSSRVEEEERRKPQEEGYSSSVEHLMVALPSSHLHIRPQPTASSASCTFGSDIVKASTGNEDGTISSNEKDVFREERSTVRVLPYRHEEKRMPIGVLRERYVEACIRHVLSYRPEGCGHRTEDAKEQGAVEPSWDSTRPDKEPTSSDVFEIPFREAAIAAPTWDVTKEVPEVVMHAFLKHHLRSHAKTYQRLINALSLASSFPLRSGRGKGEDGEEVNQDGNTLQRFSAPVEKVNPIKGRYAKEAAEAILPPPVSSSGVPYDGAKAMLRVGERRAVEYHLLEELEKVVDLLLLRVRFAPKGKDAKDLPDEALIDKACGGFLEYFALTSCSFDTSGIAILENPERLMEEVKRKVSERWEASCRTAFPLVGRLLTSLCLLSRWSLWRAMKARQVHGAPVHPTTEWIDDEGAVEQQEEERERGEVVSLASHGSHPRPPIRTPAVPTLVSRHVGFIQIGFSATPWSFPSPCEVPAASAGRFIPTPSSTSRYRFPLVTPEDPICYRAMRCRILTHVLSLCLSHFHTKKTEAIRKKANHQEDPPENTMEVKDRKGASATEECPRMEVDLTTLLTLGNVYDQVEVEEKDFLQQLTGGAVVSSTLGSSSLRRGRDQQAVTLTKTEMGTTETSLEKNNTQGHTATSRSVSHSSREREAHAEVTYVWEFVSMFFTEWFTGVVREGMETLATHVMLASVPSCTREVFPARHDKRGAEEEEEERVETKRPPVMSMPRPDSSFPPPLYRLAHFYSVPVSYSVLEYSVQQRLRRWCALPAWLWRHPVWNLRMDAPGREKTIKQVVHNARPFPFRRGHPSPATAFPAEKKKSEGGENGCSTPLVHGTENEGANRFSHPLAVDAPPWSLASSEDVSSLLLDTRRRERKTDFVFPWMWRWSLLSCMGSFLPSFLFSPLASSSSSSVVSHSSPSPTSLTIPMHDATSSSEGILPDIHRARVNEIPFPSSLPCLSRMLKDWTVALLLASSTGIPFGHSTASPVGFEKGRWATNNPLFSHCSGNHKARALAHLLCHTVEETTTRESSRALSSSSFSFSMPYSSSSRASSMWEWEQHSFAYALVHAFRGALFATEELPLETMQETHSFTSAMLSRNRTPSYGTWSSSASSSTRTVKEGDIILFFGALLEVLAVVRQQPAMLFEDEQVERSATPAEHLQDGEAEEERESLRSDTTAHHTSSPVETKEESLPLRHCIDVSPSLSISMSSTVPSFQALLVQSLEKMLSQCLALLEAYQAERGEVFCSGQAIFCSSSLKSLTYLLAGIAALQWSSSSASFFLGKEKRRSEGSGEGRWREHHLEKQGSPRGGLPVSSAHPSHPELPCLSSLVSSVSLSAFPDVSVQASSFMTALVRPFLEAMVDAVDQKQRRSAAGIGAVSAAPASPLVSGGGRVLVGIPPVSLIQYLAILDPSLLSLLLRTQAQGNHRRFRRSMDYAPLSGSSSSSWASSSTHDDDVARRRNGCPSTMHSHTDPSLTFSSPIATPLDCFLHVLLHLDWSAPEANDKEDLLTEEHDKEAEKEGEASGATPITMVHRLVATRGIGWLSEQVRKGMKRQQQCSEKEDEDVERDSPSVSTGTGNRREKAVFASSDDVPSPRRPSLPFSSSEQQQQHEERIQKDRLLDSLIKLIGQAQALSDTTPATVGRLSYVLDTPQLVEKRSKNLKFRIAQLLFHCFLKHGLDVVGASLAVKRGHSATRTPSSFQRVVYYAPMEALPARRSSRSSSSYAGVPVPERVMECIPFVSLYTWCQLLAGPRPLSLFWGTAFRKSWITGVPASSRGARGSPQAYEMDRRGSKNGSGGGGGAPLSLYPSLDEMVNPSAWKHRPGARAMGSSSNVISLDRSAFPYAGYGKHRSMDTTSIRNIKFHHSGFVFLAFLQLPHLEEMRSVLGPFSLLRLCRDMLLYYVQRWIGCDVEEGCLRQDEQRAREKYALHLLMDSWRARNTDDAAACVKAMKRAGTWTNEEPFRWKMEGEHNGQEGEEPRKGNTRANGLSSRTPTPSRRPSSRSLPSEETVRHPGTLAGTAPAFFPPYWMNGSTRFSYGSSFQCSAENALPSPEEEEEAERQYQPSRACTPPSDGLPRTQEAMASLRGIHLWYAYTHHLLCSMVWNAEGTALLTREERCKVLYQMAREEQLAKDHFYQRREALRELQGGAPSWSSLSSSSPLPPLQNRKMERTSSPRSSSAWTSSSSAITLDVGLLMEITTLLETVYYNGGVVMADAGLHHLEEEVFFKWIPLWKEQGVKEPCRRKGQREEELSCLSRTMEQRSEDQMASPILTWHRPDTKTAPPQQPLDLVERHPLSSPEGCVSSYPASGTTRWLLSLFHLSTDVASIPESSPSILVVNSSSVSSYWSDCMSRLMEQEQEAGTYEEKQHRDRMQGGRGYDQHADPDEDDSKLLTPLVPTPSGLWCSSATLLRAICRQQQELVENALQDALLHQPSKEHQGRGPRGTEIISPSLTRTGSAVSHTLPPLPLVNVYEVSLRSSLHVYHMSDVVTLFTLLAHRKYSFPIGSPAVSSSCSSNGPVHGDASIVSSALFAIVNIMEEHLSFMDAADIVRGVRAALQWYQTKPHMLAEVKAKERWQQEKGVSSPLRCGTLLKGEDRRPMTVSSFPPLSKEDLTQWSDLYREVHRFLCAVPVVCANDVERFQLGQLIYLFASLFLPFGSSAFSHPPTRTGYIRSTSAMQEHTAPLKTRNPELAPLHVCSTPFHPGAEEHKEKADEGKGSLSFLQEVRQSSLVSPETARLVADRLIVAHGLETTKWYATFERYRIVLPYIRGVPYECFSGNTSVEDGAKASSVQTKRGVCSVPDECTRVKEELQKFGLLPFVGREDMLYMTLVNSLSSSLLHFSDVPPSLSCLVQKGHSLSSYAASGSLPMKASRADDERSQLHCFLRFLSFMEVVSQN